MKKSKQIFKKNKRMQGSEEPWACFETSGPTKDGKVEFTISWNKAFIQKLRDVGFEGETEEELTQLFFISTRMLPESMIDDDAVNAEATPRLSSDTNILKK